MTPQRLGSSPGWVIPEQINGGSLESTHVGKKQNIAD